MGDGPSRGSRAVLWRPDHKRHMKVNTLTTLCLLLLLLMMTYGFRSTDFTFKKQGNGLKNTSVRQIVFHPNDSNIIMTRDNEYLYVSFNKGKLFEVLLRKRALYDVFVTDEVALLSADDGLYAVDLSSYQAEKMLGARNDDPFVSAVAVNGVIYAATQQDIYQKDSFSARFQKISVPSYSNTFQKLLIFNQQLYAITQKAVLGFSDGAWQEVLKIGITGEPETPLIKDVIVVDGRLFVATARGIYLSAQPDHADWQLLEGIHIASDDMRALSHINYFSNDPSHGMYRKESDIVNGLLIGTLNGLFIVRDNHAERLVDGLESQEVADVVYHEGVIYAATDKGIFITRPMELKSANTDVSSINQVWADDPEIEQVQAWAIDMAEVSPQKIAEWRKLAKKKALLPRVSMGVDGGHDWGASNSLWGSSSGALLLGPDDKTYGGDIGWDITLSWDLSDYIWSTDQTTIDGRSKLMVELREDILDQVTRYYFERRRLIAESRFTQAASEYEQFQKQLRIEELTAYLDGYTGGKFSSYAK